MPSKVLTVQVSTGHTMSKPVVDSITLVAGFGVEGDAHNGTTVKHRSRVRQDPTQPNLRQVHLMHAELFDELRDMGFDVRSGMLGENITTSGIDLLGLPVGARLHIGAEAIVEVTGLRNPCAQIDGIAPGLMDACLARDSNGKLIRKTGMFSIVVVGGVVRAGDAIKLEMPVGEQVRMQPV